MKELGRKYKRLRIEKNLTQAELAEVIGATHSTVAKWESGVSLPRAKELRILAEFFNVSADYLIGLTDDRTPYYRKQYNDAHEEIEHLAYKQKGESQNVLEWKGGG